MNHRILKAENDVSRALTIAQVLEEQLHKIYPIEGQVEAMERAQNLTAVLITEISKAQADIEELEHDSRIVDVFRTVSELRS